MGCLIDDEFATLFIAARACSTCGSAEKHNQTALLYRQRITCIKLRMQQGREAKARRGELGRVLAPGYVMDADQRIVLDDRGRAVHATLCRIAMDNRAVLNIGPCTDADEIDVGTQHAIVPDAGPRPDLDRTGGSRHLRHELSGTGRQIEAELVMASASA